MATTATETNKRIARRVPEEIATERNLDLIEEVFASDAREYGPLLDDPALDTESRREFIEGMFEAFPDFEARVEDIVAEGDTVAMRVTLSGTHEGEFNGIPATGKRFEVPNMVFTRIEDGKIVERWVQPDMLGMFQQLGVIDPPGT